MKKSFILSWILIGFSTYAYSTVAEWSVLVFIQADNDLASFAELNVASLEKGLAGVSDLPVNILVQWDKPYQNKTNRYLITSTGRVDVDSSSLEMGYNPQLELTNSISWMITHYPAQKYAAILWDHGSGIEDLLGNGFTASKYISKILHDHTLSHNWLEHPAVLSFAEQVNLFLTEQERAELLAKGILYDYTQQTLLTNQGLTACFSQIKKLLGRNIDVIGMDACYMAMIEVAYQVKDYANYLVGSEETEPGLGWNYEGLVKRIIQAPSMEAPSFCRAVVDSYADFYQHVENEPSFTQSAINLSKIAALKKNIDDVIVALADCATVNSSWVTTTKKIAFQSAERFGEPKYVDLYSWYENIESQALALKEFCLDPEPTRGFLPEKRVVLSKQRGARSRLSRTDRIKLSLVKKQNLLQKRDALIARIREGKALIESLVIANAAGSEHAAAHGISIYYPTKTQGVHSSYKKTLFWQDSRWSTFIPFS